MRDIHVIDFSAPMDGLTDEFNTVRLGMKLSRSLEPGDTVMLVEKPKSVLIGWAQVIRTDVGTLKDIAARYAALNHNQKGLDPDGAPARLIENMVKRYGPHKCGENSKVTMIHLKRE